jgi:uncharacterized protein DUF6869
MALGIAQCTCSWAEVGMTVVTDENLISAWLELQRAERDTPPFEALFWAEIELSRLAREEPGRCWKLMLEILKRDQSSHVIESLSSGALEEFLAEHGEEFIDTVEKHAQRDSVFAHLLGGVWQGEMNDDIWARVQRAASQRW